MYNRASVIGTRLMVAYTSLSGPNVPAFHHADVIGCATSARHTFDATSGRAYPPPLMSAVHAAPMSPSARLKSSMTLVVANGMGATTYDASMQSNPAASIVIVYAVETV